MSIARRMISGTFANSAGLGFTAVLQILSVPVLTSAWGVERYGIWLMLTTIPTYFALSDLGFAAAATSDMTMQVARGARDQALKTFQSLFVLVATTSMILIAIASAVFLVPSDSYGAALQWLHENAGAVFLLVLYSALVLSSRITLTAFRATGNYSIGTIVYNAFFLTEGLLLLAVAWVGGGILQCIVAQLIFRIVSIVVFHVWLRRLVPWLFLGVRHASVTEIRRLFRPALAAMAIPTSLAFNLQGIVLVVGMMLSPVAAATLVPVRTASRLVIQVIGAVNRATMPELSRAVAQENRPVMAKLVLVNFASIALILMPGAVVFSIFGPALVSLWTKGHVHPDPMFVTLMAIGMVLNGLWYFGTNLLLAANAHTGIATSLLTVSVASILMALPAAQFAGLDGVACVLIVTETACLLIVALEFARHNLITGRECRAVFKQSGLWQLGKLSS